MKDKTPLVEIHIKRAIITNIMGGDKIDEKTPREDIEITLVCSPYTSNGEDNIVIKSLPDKEKIKIF